MEEGDLLFIPPVWYHRTISVETENINLNWTATKKKSIVLPKAKIREHYRCYLYKKSMDNKFFNIIFNGVNTMLPVFAKIKWCYSDLQAANINFNNFGLIRFILKEVHACVPALFTIKKMRNVLREISRTNKNATL